MRRVFLSSTYRDLAEHRVAVIAAINALDSYKCVCMEDFGARDARAASACFDKVAEADLFLGLVGHVYGAMDPGSKKSFTELEIEAARKLGKPRLMFLAREDAPLPINLVENDESRKKQVQLRQRISAERVRDTFGTPADLVERVVRAIHNWEHTDEQFRGLVRPLPPQSSFEHPYPIQENFTGRFDERQVLTDWIASDSRSLFCVTAMGGMGKSALTWVWLQRDVLGLPMPGAAAEERDDMLACRVPEASRPEGVLWWSFYEGESSFSAFLDSALYYASRGQYRSTVSDDEKARLLVSLLQQHRYLIVLDGFERQLSAYAVLNAAYIGDVVNDEDRVLVDPAAKVFFRHLLAQATSGRVVITSRLYPLELEGLATRRMELTGLSPQDAEHFLRAQKIAGGSVELRGACETYGYHPLALRLLAGLVANDPMRPGDIRVASEYERVVQEGQKGRQHHVLEIAYNALSPSERLLLSQIAAFRFPVTYSVLEQTLCVDQEKADGFATGIFRKFRRYYESEQGFHRLKDLRHRLGRLIKRGLVFFDRERQRYDLHPIVRHYAYDRLTDKAGTHARAKNYYALLPDSNLVNVRTIEDFAPAIELYHHTLRAGLHEQAFQLFIDRIQRPLLKTLCAAQTYNMLVHALFPDGEALPTGLRGKGQTMAIACLAHSYRLMGEPARSAGLYRIAIDRYARAGFRAEHSVTLLQLGLTEVLLGELRLAEEHLRAVAGEPVGHRFEEYTNLARESLAQLMVFTGRFSEGEQILREMDSLPLTYNRSEVLALLALEGNDIASGVQYGRGGIAVAAASGYKLDCIRAQCLLGTILVRGSYLENEPAKTLGEADALLKMAYETCMEVKLIELEPDIRLARALWLAANRRTEEAYEALTETLAIARKSKYRLKMAEIQLAMAEVVLDSDIPLARQHLGQARDAALCDGGSHCYELVLGKVARLEQSSTPQSKRFAV
jgi:hypothetical protein